MTDHLVDPGTPYALIDRALSMTADARQETIARRLHGAADALRRRGDLVAALVTQHLAEALAREVGVAELRSGGKPIDLPPSSALNQVHTAAAELVQAVRAAMEEMIPGSTRALDTAPIGQTAVRGGFQYDAGDGWIGYVGVIGDVVVEGRWRQPAIGGDRAGAAPRHLISSGMTAVEIAARLLIAANPGRAAFAAFTRAPQMLPTLCALHPPVDSARLPSDERVTQTPESRSTGWCILAVDAAVDVAREAKVSYTDLEPALALVAGGKVLRTLCWIDGRRAWRVAITIPQCVSPSFLARWLYITQPWPQEYVGPEQVATIDERGVLHTFAFGWLHPAAEKPCAGSPVSRPS